MGALGLAVEARNTAGEGGDVNAGTGTGRTSGSGWRRNRTGRSVPRGRRAAQCINTNTAEPDRNSNRGCATEHLDRRLALRPHWTLLSHTCALVTSSCVLLIAKSYAYATIAEGRLSSQIAVRGDLHDVSHEIRPALRVGCGWRATPRGALQPRPESSRFNCGQQTEYAREPQRASRVERTRAVA